MPGAAWDRLIDWGPMSKFGLHDAILPRSPISLSVCERFHKLPVFASWQSPLTFACLTTYTAMTIEDHTGCDEEE